jgi:hypothetical protein
MTNSTESSQTTAPASRRDPGYDEQGERLDAPQPDRDRAPRDVEATRADADRTPRDDATPADANSTPRDEAMPAAADGIPRDQAAQPQEPARAPSDRQLAPGSAVDDPVAALWGADLVERYREQWRELQLQFVDEPRTATEQAAALVNDAVQSLTSALTAQKQTLDDWQSADRGDTEILRVALRRYRDFLDRLLGM